MTHQRDFSPMYHQKRWALFVKTCLVCTIQMKSLQLKLSAAVLDHPIRLAVKGIKTILMNSQTVMKLLAVMLKKFWPKLLTTENKSGSIQTELIQFCNRVLKKNVRKMKSIKFSSNEEPT